LKTSCTGKGISTRLIKIEALIELYAKCFNKTI